MLFLHRIEKKADPPIWGSTQKTLKGYQTSLFDILLISRYVTHFSISMEWPLSENAKQLYCVDFLDSSLSKKVYPTKSMLRKTPK